MAQITLNEFGCAFAYVIPNILANRLLIAVRANYYIRVSDVNTYLPSLQFRLYDSRHSTTLSEAYTVRAVDMAEIRTFNERTGV
jgi:hypothetical protein